MTGHLSTNHAEEPIKASKTKQNKTKTLAVVQRRAAKLCQGKVAITSSVARKMSERRKCR